MMKSNMFVDVASTSVLLVQKGLEACDFCGVSEVYSQDKISAFGLI